MKPRSWILAFVALAALAVGAGWLLYQKMMPPAAADAPLDAEQARIAMRFLDHLDAAEWDAALAMTTPAVREGLADGKLEKIWTELPGQLGGRKSRGEPRGAAVQGHPLVSVPFEFGLLTLDAWISFDASNVIQGFRLVPARPSAPKEVTFESNERFSERALQVGSDERALGGTLTVPAGAGPFPAVVLVHGSGPHDRDSSIGPNAPLRDLAHGLAERGIASLRYDKRTRARPQDFESGVFTVDDETVHDAVLAVAAVRNVPEVDARRVFIAGHSLGAMMAPRIGQRLPDLAGLILLAAPARSLDDIYLQQIEYIAGLDGLDDGERANIEAERDKAARVATLTPDTPTAENLLGLPSSYWIDLRDYDPVAVARTLSQPMLIVQGGRDYQVTVAEDFVRWREAFADDPRVTLAEFPALNHLLIAGEGMAKPAEYAVAGQVDAAALDAIADWVRAR